MYEREVVAAGAKGASELRRAQNHQRTRFVLSLLAPHEGRPLCTLHEHYSSFSLAGEVRQHTIMLIASAPPLINIAMIDKTKAATLSPLACGAGQHSAMPSRPCCSARVPLSQSPCATRASLTSLLLSSRTRVQQASVHGMCSDSPSAAGTHVCNLHDPLDACSAMKFRLGSSAVLIPRIGHLRAAETFRHRADVSKWRWMIRGREQIR